MKNLNVVYLVACGISLLVSGCQSRPPLNREALQQIKEGVSTRPEVEKMLGKADDVLSGANQKTLTMYQDRRIRMKLHLLKDEYEYSFLSAYFLFEPEGILERKFVSDTQTTSTIQWGVRTVGEPITSDKLAKVIPKLTTYEQVRELFGPPISEALTINGAIVRRWTFLRETMISGPNLQMIEAYFDDADHLVDYVVRDDVPEEKKIKPR
jgi:hypothetical protein